MRLTARTHAGRAGKQSLNARAFSPLAHMCAQRPSLRLAARDPQLAGLHLRRPTLNGWSPWLDRAAARFRLDASPTSWGSRAPAVLRRAGLRPHLQTGCWGTLKTLGRFFRRRLPRAIGSTGWGRCDLRHYCVHRVHNAICTSLGFMVISNLKCHWISVILVNPK